MNETLTNVFTEQATEDINKTIEILKAHNTVSILYSKGELSLNIHDLDTARVKFIEWDGSMEIITRDFGIKFDLIGSETYVIESGAFEGDDMNLITFDNGDSHISLTMWDGK